MFIDVSYDSNACGSKSFTPPNWTTTIHKEVEIKPGLPQTKTHLQQRPPCPFFSPSTCQGASCCRISAVNLLMAWSTSPRWTGPWSLITWTKEWWTKIRMVQCDVQIGSNSRDGPAIHSWFTSQGCKGQMGGPQGWGIKKKINKRIKKKLFPGDQKKNIMRIKIKLFTWIETLSCGRGAKIASLTGSKKIIRPGSLPKNDMKNCTQFWPGAHSLVKMYETHYARMLEVREGAAPPPQTHCWRPWWWSLFWTCCCCCCCCCSWLLWILWMVLVLVLVLVVLVPWEEGTFKRNKKAGGGLVGRAQRLPPRCIADDHDGGLFFEPVVVPASGCFQVPPPPDEILLLLLSLLERRCSCCCCRCSGGGPPKKSSCCSLLLWILSMALVLVVLVPWEEATFKKNKKAGGGLGGRARRLPPRRIADDHDGGLCFEPAVVVVVVVVIVVVVAILEKAAQSKATATISTFKTEKIVLLPCWAPDKFSYDGLFCSCTSEVSLTIYSKYSIKIVSILYV